MTKDWEIYEDTIKSLYAKYTLATVRRIMGETYGFKASTRAYRRRLIQWGVRKYNRRQRDSSSKHSDSESSTSGSSSETDPTAAFRGSQTGSLSSEELRNFPSSFTSGTDLDDSGAWEGGAVELQQQYLDPRLTYTPEFNVSGRPPSRTPAIPTTSASTVPSYQDYPYGTDYGNSEESDQESAFSKGTLASSASSVNSTVFAARDLFVDLFMQDGDLDALFNGIFSSKDISPYLFKEKFNRILRQYAGELRAKARSNIEKRAIFLVKSQASRVSELLAWKYLKLESARKDNGHRKENAEQGLPPAHVSRYRPMSDSEFDSHSSDDEAIDNSIEQHHFEPLKVFLTSHGALDGLKARLADFASQIPPSKRTIPLQQILSKLSTYRSQFFLRAVEYIADPAMKAQLNSQDRKRLLSLLFEFDAFRPRELKALTKLHVSLADVLKCWMEDTTGSKWNWWPFSPPQKPLSPGHSVLTWTCACGSTRTEQMPVHLAHYLKQCVAQYNNTTASSSSSSTSNIEMPAISSSSYPGQRYPSSGDSSNGRSSTDITDYDTYPHPADMKNASIALDCQSERYVFLLVKSSLSYLVNMDVSKMRAMDFFKDLITQYAEKRGMLRYWFSIYVYNHCDFVRIQKWSSSRFAANPEFAFPPAQDTRYSFRPRPMPVNPIPAEIFKDLFYGCYDTKNPGHRLHLACHPIHSIADEIMERLPKRDHPVITETYDGGRLEEFWGLAAKERRSAFRVLLYLILCLLPTVAFLFAWLFGWGHVEDLQGATAPVAITLALMTFLWTVIYSGAGGDD
ncbi:hypothetical protein F4778DRAFT_749708 [Xylariomycetidae sp. FL2044]|nr:hypothetical protein F4778DRAFT_749708 [Xylariomycetidae sp. FL2044]